MLPGMNWQAKSVARTGGEQLPWVATVANDAGEERTACSLTYERAVLALAELLAEPAQPSVDAAAVNSPALSAVVDVDASGNGFGADVAPAGAGEDARSAVVPFESLVDTRHAKRSKR